ncbi:3-phosphoshikimate 1-carboxyvinyltransferase [Dehalogenimonas sp. THU2]|uniref:3-phosphoshikimate 1-carboxyvinyltransferase n=1 Tax=Dehalogenimonas sp. THU2 TaxID=3151121 RepID=UPI00321874DE
MKASISKSVVSGAIAAPPSKSYTIRALFAAALAEGVSRISNPLVADDTEAAAEVLAQLGAVIERQPGVWTVSGGHLKPPRQNLNCRQSAATLRFLAPVCAMLDGESRITFDPGLARRPMTPILEVFSQLSVESELTDTCLDIHGGGSRFQTGVVSLPGNISSQFISGLLLAAPLAPDGLNVRLTTPAESRDYLRMTVYCLRRFGIVVETAGNLTEFRVQHQAYQAADYTVEGDWSSASYFIGLGAIAGGLTVTGLNENSFQADRFMLNCLRRMGAGVNIAGDSVTVSPSPLRAVEIDLNEAIDLLPTVACLAAVAEGESAITGLERARLKESDRVSAVAGNLKRMGIEVVEEAGRMTVTGGTPRGAVIDSHDDHRIAMAFAMLAATCGDTVIEGAGCVAKTYPGFWQDFETAGGKVIISE